MSTSTKKKDSKEVQPATVQHPVWNQHINRITSTEGWISYNIWKVVTYMEMNQCVKNRKDQQRRVKAVNK